jgi:hypothetical protein
MAGKLADELHKPVRRHFRKRRVLVRGIAAVWAVDLIGMQHCAKDNDNFKFILAVIYVFSKFGWMRVLKQKTGVEVAHALSDIITSVAGSLSKYGATRGQDSTINVLRNWWIL